MHNPDRASEPGNISQINPARKPVGACRVQRGSTSPASSTITSSAERCRTILLSSRKRSARNGTMSPGCAIRICLSSARRKRQVGLSDFQRSANREHPYRKWGKCFCGCSKSGHQSGTRRPSSYHRAPFLNEPVRHKDCWPEITQELGSSPVASVEAFSGSMRTALRQELWTRMRGRVGNFSNILHEAAIG